MPAELLLILCTGPRIGTVPISLSGYTCLGGANPVTKHERLLRQWQSLIGSHLDHLLRFKTAAIGCNWYAAYRISQQNPSKMVLHLVFAPAYALSQTLRCMRDGRPALDSQPFTYTQTGYRQQRKACDNRACSRQILLCYLDNFFFSSSKILSYSSPQIRHGRQSACPKPATKHKVSHIRQRRR